MEKINKMLRDHFSGNESKVIVLEAPITKGLHPNMRVSIENSLMEFGQHHPNRTYLFDALDKLPIDKDARLSSQIRHLDENDLIELFYKIFNY